MGNNSLVGTGAVNGTPIAFADDSQAKDVAALLAAAVKVISDEGAKTVAERDKPLFFPNGIDLILLEFKIGDKINITLKISGVACCKEAGTADQRSGEPIVG